MTFFDMVTYIFMAMFAIPIAWFIAVSAWIVIVIAFLGTMTFFGIMLVWCADTKDAIVRKWRKWK
jgi:membrane-bound ClpP family serine protease